ncbi:hypothetical protein [Evansella tamaricis]|uniref:Uncharacterized protein n=1 Tax=Evansella tamaricis TaxID=2069301 RepID=A0ABS6JHK4_9BACI|nr:hypothetical protein [Evansella tamaricis]MBU9713113.1 hypothetical protein [Evansella tamaricis]
MDQYEKDAYFELRDKLIKRLPEPEKSVYSHFRKLEKENLKKQGRLIVNGRSAIESTAEHFMMEISEVKAICLRATNQLKELAQKY